MSLSRRHVLAGLAATAAGALAWERAAAETAASAQVSPIQVIIPSGWSPPLLALGEDEYRRRLARAVLDFVATAYGQRPLPLWNRPLSQVDLESRVSLLTRHVLEAVRRQAQVYALDPAWVLAQILGESFFYEFAISSVFAVGVCQFMPATAREHGMVCAGDLAAHAAPPYRLAELAQEDDHYARLRGQLRELRKHYARFDADGRVRHLLEALAAGQPVADAREHLDYLDRARRLNIEIKEVKERFRRYLQANFEGRNIFDPEDAAFLDGFDQRVTYQRSVPAMVQMLTRALKARNGNILAAAAAYHAGLGNTDEDGIYAPYGRIPGIEATATYVSRLCVNHHEIVRRLA